MKTINFCEAGVHRAPRIAMHFDNSALLSVLIAVWLLNNNEKQNWFEARLVLQLRVRLSRV